MARTKLTIPYIIENCSNENITLDIYLIKCRSQNIIGCAQNRHFFYFNITYGQEKSSYTVELKIYLEQEK